MIPPHARISNTPVALLRWSLLICLVSCTPTKSQNNISSGLFKASQACGPRCLSAFMRLTGVGKPTCDVKYIYHLIGKTPYSVTTLKDLRDVAQQLGFFAVGYELTPTQLQNLNGYAVLPIGPAQGTRDDPFHFILVQSSADGYLNIINTTTLKRNHITFSQLQNSWTGYALVLSLSAIPLQASTF